MPFLKKMAKQRNSGKRACHCDDRGKPIHKEAKKKTKKKGENLSQAKQMFSH